MLRLVPAEPPPAYRERLGPDLPTEILHQIFEDTIHLDDPSLKDVRLAQTTIVSCTRVCRHWRYAAFSQKGLWACMVDVQRQSVPCLRRLLRVSFPHRFDVGHRSAPVSFHHPKDIEEICHLLGVLRLLLQHQHRIREFHVEWCEVEASTTFSNARPVLALAEFQMPQLEALTWSRRRSGSDEPLPSNTSLYLGPDLIKLERVSIIGKSFQLTSSSCHLTQFTLISPTNRPTCMELVVFLQGTPNIQFLHLNDAVDPDHAALFAPLALPAITLPHLSFLAIEGKEVEQMVWKLEFMKALPFIPSEPCAFQITLPPLDLSHFYREYMEEYIAVMVETALPEGTTDVKMQLVVDRSDGCTLSTVVDGDPFDTLDFASNGSKKVLDAIQALPGARAWTLQCAAMGMDRAIDFMRYTQSRTSSLKIRVVDSGCRPNANIREQRKLAKGLCELHQLTELSIDHDAALLLLPLLALPIDALCAMSLHSFLPRLQHLCLESCDCVAYPELFRNLEMTLDNRRFGLPVLKVTFVRCHVKVHEVLDLGQRFGQHLQSGVSPIPRSRWARASSASGREILADPIFARIIIVEAELLGLGSVKVFLGEPLYAVARAGELGVEVVDRLVRLHNGLEGWSKLLASEGVPADVLEEDMLLGLFCIVIESCRIGCSNTSAGCPLRKTSPPTAHIWTRRSLLGLSKANPRAGELTTAFCGTTEYLAREILLDEQGYGKVVDFWSMGVLLDVTSDGLFISLNIYDRAAQDQGFLDSLEIKLTLVHDHTREYKETWLLNILMVCERLEELDVTEPYRNILDHLTHTKDPSYVRLVPKLKVLTFRYNHERLASIGLLELMNMVTSRTQLDLLDYLPDDSIENYVRLTHVYLYDVNVSVLQLGLTAWEAAKLSGLSTEEWPPIPDSCLAPTEDIFPFAEEAAEGLQVYLDAIQGIGQVDVDTVDVCKEAEEVLGRMEGFDMEAANSLIFLALTSLSQASSAPYTTELMNYTPNGSPSSSATPEPALTSGNRVANTITIIGRRRSTPIPKRLRLGDDDDLTRKEDNREAVGKELQLAPDYAPIHREFEGPRAGIHRPFAVHNLHPIGSGSAIERRDLIRVIKRTGVSGRRSVDGGDKPQCIMLDKFCRRSLAQAHFHLTSTKIVKRTSRKARIGTGSP
ncbi:hypothetical protein NMY22_g157 [Coprinellus aureogranulatus]|nr:hypothetical protein NMY22_g157 [Coprinellus aureogranulatus]